MKMNHHNQQFSNPNHLETDAQPPIDFDDLVLRATHGDSRALAAIAVVLGPVLLDEARSVMGAFKQDAEDVLQDFFLFLYEGRSPFLLTHGNALPWMRRTIRAMARTHRVEREREWGVGDGP